jgi:hypothetical protein
VIESFDLFLVKKFEHVFLQRARALAGDDFDHGSLGGDGLGHDVVQGLVDVAAFVENVVQIQY